ncbi:hypothetical protein PENSPDRAFT_166348 [Peniophora sp. CONT]|nr:hypothetical protein PENSPDRAFT_166348 [Peniophora sp. CONT]
MRPTLSKKSTRLWSGRMTSSSMSAPYMRAVMLRTSASTKSPSFRLQSSAYSTTYSFRPSTTPVYVLVSRPLSPSDAIHPIPVDRRPLTVEALTFGLCPSLLIQRIAPSTASSTSSNSPSIHSNSNTAHSTLTQDRRPWSSFLRSSSPCSLFRLFAPLPPFHLEFARPC